MAPTSRSTAAGRSSRRRALLDNRQEQRYKIKTYARSFRSLFYARPPRAHAGSPFHLEEVRVFTRSGVAAIAVVLAGLGVGACGKTEGGSTAQESSATGATPTETKPVGLEG